MDILFSAIRKLQSEVARLRNSFNYGIYSYTGKNTAMSRVVSGLEKDPEDEPLWCVDPEDLSSIKVVNIGLGSGLDPEASVDTSVEGILKLTGDVYWSDYDKTLKYIEDPKMFMYMTVSSLKVKIAMTAKDVTKELDLSTLGLGKLDTYNIMVCISRKVKEIGRRYVYISIGNA